MSLKKMLTSRGPNIDPCGNPRVMGIIRSYLRLILLFGNGYLGNLLAVCRLLCSHRIRGTSQSTDRVARNQKLGLNPLQLTQLIRPCLKTTSIPHTYVLMRIGIHICSWMPTRISKIYFHKICCHLISHWSFENLWYGNQNAHRPIIFYL